MRLTAYDLARDKSAVLSAVLDALPVVEPMCKEEDEEVKPAKAPKPPRFRNNKAFFIARREKVLAMALAGHTRAKICTELGISFGQYERAIRTLKANGKLHKDFKIHGSKIAPSDGMAEELAMLPVSVLIKKYGCSESTIYKLRWEHGIKGVCIRQTKFTPEHDEIVLKYGPKKAAQLTGFSESSVARRRDRLLAEMESRK